MICITHNFGLFADPQVVVANILETRKQEVILVTSEDTRPIRLTEKELQSGTEIEERIVADLVQQHQQFKEKS